ncbi:hypothetical protein [Thauera phenolivorans]|uniref:hypothetical protein n=1 Tax=Thauera phenolivorans TaxID=1792543 RepID=UPI001301461B|nr:hypothetical protein [Thauera phenolivorans]
MKRISATLAFLLTAGLGPLGIASDAAAVQAVHRCEVDGRVIYSDLPCAVQPAEDRRATARGEAAADSVQTQTPAETDGKGVTTGPNARADGLD